MLRIFTTLYKSITNDQSYLIASPNTNTCQTSDYTLDNLPINSLGYELMINERSYTRLLMIKNNLDMFFFMLNNNPMEKYEKLACERLTICLEENNQCLDMFGRNDTNIIQTLFTQNQRYNEKITIVVNQRNVLIEQLNNSTVDVDTNERYTFKELAEMSDLDHVLIRVHKPFVENMHNTSDKITELADQLIVGTKEMDDLEKVLLSLWNILEYLFVDYAHDIISKIRIQQLDYIEKMKLADEERKKNRKTLKHG